MDVGMFQGRKILVTGGGGYFNHKLGNELKNMGAVVVLFDISRPLDEVVNEQMECLHVDLTRKLRNLLWIILPIQSIRILPLFYAQTKIDKIFTTGKILRSYFNLLCERAGSRREVFSKDSRILL